MISDDPYPTPLLDNWTEEISPLKTGSSFASYAVVVNPEVTNLIFISG